MHKLNEARFVIILLALMVVFGAIEGLAVKRCQFPASSFVVSIIAGALVGVFIVGIRAFVYRQVQQGRFRWLHRQ